MSVTDPLIKDIKACVQQFFKEIESNAQITDHYFYLVLFCQTLEKIFHQGLIIQQNTLYFNRLIDPYCWMSSIVNEQCDIINYAYVSSVDRVKEKTNLRTNTAKFRLLLKHCLVKKCLHVPLQFLMRTDRVPLFYMTNSIIGDEILSEILLSVLLQVGKFNFALDLDTSSFLDCSWYLPKVLNFELVPCKALGVSVSFAGDRAVIVNVQSNGVAAETEKICIGDILDKLNNVAINTSSKGKLSSILRSSKLKPVQLCIIKAYNEETQEFFNPIKILLKELKLDIEEILKQYTEPSKEVIQNKKFSGFEVTYLGKIDVGDDGSVKQIDKALRIFLSTNRTYQDETEKMLVTRINKKVFFEIGEIGVRLRDIDTNTLIDQYPYMKISSCGQTPSLKYNFGFIAGTENCDVENKFVCYVFHSNDFEEINTVLQSIGQGFHRTHFAV